MAATGAELHQHVGSQRDLRRPLGIGLIVSALILGVLVMLWPAVAAPLNADQQYMYLNAAGRVQGNWLDIIGIPWSEIAFRAEQGRVAPVGYIIQWFFYTGITEFAVATGTPLIVLHGLQKLFLFAAAVLCVAAFAKSLRGRAPDGRIAGLSRSTIWLVIAGTAVLGAVGMQAHLQFRNGWLTYPVLTYGAVIVGFGVPALALWLTRRMSERSSRWHAVAAVVAMVATGIFLNVSYELYYAAFPATILGLLLQPSPPGPARRTARLAALTTGLALTFSFITSFVIIRLWTSNACADDCYHGVDAQLGSQTVETSWYNLASSLPLSGRTELLADISRVGIGRLPGPFSSPLTIACVIAMLALVAARFVLRPSANARWPGIGDRDDAVIALARAESGAALRGAAVALALGLGSAVVMSVSAQAPEIIEGIGYPYRHIVVTWIGLCVAGVLCLVALDRVRPRVGFGMWATVGVLALLVAGTMLPINMQATRAENLSPRSRVTEAIYREVILGDPAPQADERRCATLGQMNDYGIPPGTQRFLTNSVQWAYDHFYGVPYCADPSTQPE